MEIRQAKVTDIDNMLTMLYLLDEETDYMLYKQGERKTTREQLEKQFVNQNTLTLIATDGHEINGFLTAERSSFLKLNHTAYVVIGVRANNQSMGIGSQLFDALDLWAIKEKLHRLELTVVCENHRAIQLYQKKGFKIEGVKVESLWMKNRFYDEYYMGKILRFND